MPRDRFRLSLEAPCKVPAWPLSGRLTLLFCRGQGRMLGGTVAGKVHRTFYDHKTAASGCRAWSIFTGGRSRTPSPSALVACPARNVRPSLQSSRRLCPPRARTACARARALRPPRPARAPRLSRFSPAPAGLAPAPRTPLPARFAGSVQAALDVRSSFGTSRRYGHLDGVHSYLNLHRSPLL
jgi:hypothetical protein